MQSELHEAIRKGFLNDVKHLVEKEGINVNEVMNGNTALASAIYYGHVKICEYLVQKEAKVTAERRPVNYIYLNRQEISQYLLTTCSYFQHSKIEKDLLTIIGNSIDPEELIGKLKNSFAINTPSELILFLGSTINILCFIDVIKILIKNHKSKVDPNMKFYEGFFKDLPIVYPLAKLSGARQILKENPEFITDCNINAESKTGDYEGVTVGWWLAFSVEGRQILSTNPHLFKNYNLDVSCKRGPLAGITVGWLLAATPSGREILSANTHLLKNSNLDAAGKTGPQAGITVGWWLVSTLEGRIILKANPELLNNCNLNMAPKIGQHSGETIIWLLANTTEGCDILQAYPELLKNYSWNDIKPIWNIITSKQLSQVVQFLLQTGKVDLQTINTTEGLPPTIKTLVIDYSTAFTHIDKQNWQQLLMLIKKEPWLVKACDEQGNNLLHRLVYCLNKAGKIGKFFFYMQKELLNLLVTNASSPNNNNELPYFHAEDTQLREAVRPKVSFYQKNLEGILLSQKETRRLVIDILAGNYGLFSGSVIKLTVKNPLTSHEETKSYSELSPLIEALTYCINVAITQFVDELDEYTLMKLEELRTKTESYKDKRTVIDKDNKNNASYFRATKILKPEQIMELENLLTNFQNLNNLYLRKECKSGFQTKKRPAEAIDSDITLENNSSPSQKRQKHNFFTLSPSARELNETALITKENQEESLVKDALQK